MSSTINFVTTYMKARVTLLRQIIQYLMLNLSRILYAFMVYNFPDEFMFSYRTNNQGVKINRIECDDKSLEEDNHLFHRIVWCTDFSNDIRVLINLLKDNGVGSDVLKFDFFYKNQPHVMFIRGERRVVDGEEMDVAFNELFDLDSIDTSNQTW